MMIPKSLALGDSSLQKKYKNKCLEYAKDLITDYPRERKVA